MEIRFYLDPSTGLPHIRGHGVEEQEVEDVLARPIEDRTGQDGSRVAVGQTRGGKVSPCHLRARSSAGFGVRHYGLRIGLEGVEGAPSTTEKETMKQQGFPPGWNDERVRRVLEHYEGQTDDQAVAEDEAAYESTTHTMIAVPVDLVPSVRELISKKTR